MTNKLAQQKLWRELWLIALKAFGAQQVWASRPRPPRHTPHQAPARIGVLSWKRRCTANEMEQA